MITWLVAGLPLWMQSILILLIGMTIWSACQWIVLARDLGRRSKSFRAQLEAGLQLCAHPAPGQGLRWSDLGLLPLRIDATRGGRSSELAEIYVARELPGAPRMQRLRARLHLIAQVAPVIGLGGTVYGFYIVLSTWDPATGIGAIGPSAAIAMKSTLCSVLSVVAAQLAPGVWHGRLDDEGLRDHVERFVRAVRGAEKGAHANKGETREVNDENHD